MKSGWRSPFLLISLLSKVQFPLLQTIRKSMFPLGKCFTKRFFPKFCKFLLEVGEIFKSIFAKKPKKPKTKNKTQKTSSLGEKEKKTPTYHLGRSLLLIWFLSGTAVRRTTHIKLWTKYTSSIMSKSLPCRPPAHFYSPAEPCKLYFTQSDPRNTEAAPLHSSGPKGFPSRGNNEELSLLCRSHLCWFHSLGQGKHRPCSQSTTTAVQHLFCSEFWNTTWGTEKAKMLLEKEKL